MKNFESIGLRYCNDRLELLDQTLLPHREEWVHVDSIETMVILIKRLSIRGAPLIGVGAAMALAVCGNQEQLAYDAERLRNSRPTAVNLMWAIDTMMAGPTDRDSLLEKAEYIYEKEVEMSLKMGRHGASLVAEGEGILTHCNTGGLAAPGFGTALSAIREAHEMGKNIHVYVDETRPLLQGGRLTTWELERWGVPHTLICDNMAATLMREGRIQRVFLGADRIAINGDFANKVGTYSVAVAARYHNIPFHTVAPRSTVDPHCATGADIPIEMRAADEVRREWSPKSVEVYNPSFDVTPHELVTSIVLDTGIYSEMKELKELCGQLLVEVDSKNLLASTL